MSKLPDVLGALIYDGLGVFGVPGSSTAGETVKKFLRDRSEAATAILFDELGRAEILPAQVAAEDDRVAVVYRYLRAAWEGGARVNLRLLAKAIVGRLWLNTLVPDEFLPHADALAALSRDEIVLIATMYRVHYRNDSKPVWDTAVSELKEFGWSDDHARATAGRALRSGYVIAGTGFGALKFRLSPMLLDLCKTVDFADALRREGQDMPPG
jgi:hypothetical protein